MSLHRLLGFRAAVPKPDALVAYYGELGLSGDANSGFTGTDGGAAVRIEQAPVRRLLDVEIGCTDEAEALSILDDITGIHFTVRVAEPEAPLAARAPVAENRPGSVVRVNERAPAVNEAARPPRRLGHLVIGTPDLAATRSLLVDTIGCKVSDEVDGIIHFLRCSTDHHNIGLVHSPVPILQHYSWECDDVDHVGTTATAIYRKDPERHAWGLGRHFAGSNFYWYLRDPAGAFIELYADLDRIDDDEAWERNRTPMGFEHIANAWGPNIPTEFIVPDDLAELEAAWAGVARS